MTIIPSLTQTWKQNSRPYTIHVIKSVVFRRSGFTENWNLVSEEKDHPKGEKEL